MSKLYETSPELFTVSGNGTNDAPKANKFIIDLLERYLLSSISIRDIIEIELKNRIVKLLKSERTANGETIQQMAHTLCMSKKKYQAMESGHWDFRISDIAWICEKLDVRPMILFGTDDALMRFCNELSDNEYK